MPRQQRPGDGCKTLHRRLLPSASWKRCLLTQLEKVFAIKTALALYCRPVLAISEGSRADPAMEEEDFAQEVQSPSPLITMHILLVYRK